MAEQPKPGSIVHVELHSADPAKSKQFYGEVFGWKFEERPEMNYTLWKAANDPAGGLMQTMEGRPPQVLNYILSNSVEESLRQIEDAGGIVMQPKMEIPGQGWWALFQEPGGTVMALFEATREMRAAARKAARPKKGARTAAKKAKAGKKRK
jgi:predicted enzyme related to lactoylglutathione lyase